MLSSIWPWETPRKPLSFHSLWAESVCVCAWFVCMICVCVCMIVCVYLFFGTVGYGVEGRLILSIGFSYQKWAPWQQLFFQINTLLFYVEFISIFLSIPLAFILYLGDCNYAFYQSHWAWKHTCSLRRTSIQTAWVFGVLKFYELKFYISGFLPRIYTIGLFRWPAVFVVAVGWGVWGDIRKSLLPCCGCLLAGL